MSKARQYRTTRQAPKASAEQVIDLRDNPPSEEQLAFAREALQLTFPAGATKYEVAKAIKREVLRRGREAMRRGKYRQGMLVMHPRHGACEVVRIGQSTLKVTLAPLDGGRKIVIDAMFLDDCKLVGV